MTADTMKAVIGDKLGPPEGYELREVPLAAPASGEVQIEIHVAGMGYVDALVSRGLYQVKPDVPYCPSLEFTGVISALGDNVQGLAVGDPVTASAFGGGLAEAATVPAQQVQKLPACLAPEAATGFIVNYTTAWHGLLDRGELRSGETVLVLGAAGGTGVAAIQVARLAGARVIAAASSKEKRDYALSVGAHETIDYTAPDWRKALKAMTEGRGVDVVFDPVGGSTMEPAFRSLAWRGRHLVIGFTGGDIPALPINLALLKGASLVGVDYRQFSSVFEAGQSAQVRDQLFAAVERGDLKPPVGQSFAFADFRAAMSLAVSRDGLGKTIVTIRDHADD